MPSREPRPLPRVRRPKPAQKLKETVEPAMESDLDFGLTLKVAALLRSPRPGRA